MAQKQRLVEVWADFEQTIVNKVIDQWIKQALVKAKDQNYLWCLALCGQLKCFKQL